MTEPKTVAGKSLAAHLDFIGRSSRGTSFPSAWEAIVDIGDDATFTHA